MYILKIYRHDYLVSLVPRDEKFLSLKTATHQRSPDEATISNMRIEKPSVATIRNPNRKLVKKLANE